MAQLCHWKLLYIGYNGTTTDAQRVRLQILDGLPVDIDLRDYELTLLQSVDAFLCTFAAIAVSRHDLDTPDGESSEEDRIAVHR